MYELINQTPGDMLGEERGDKLSYTRGDDPIVVKAGICPTLVGKHDVDENANEGGEGFGDERDHLQRCLLYTSTSPGDARLSRMPSSA